MGDVPDGSVVWSRASLKERFWPSVVYRTWDEAKNAGAVPDGIAFLIDAGRKIDVTDEEASPRESELLNLYLGNNPEWQFIPKSDAYVVPFKNNRDRLSKQRFGTQLKVQFMPALAAADAMVLEQQQLLSLSGSRSGGGGGDGSDGGAIVTPIRRATHGIPRKRDGVLLDFGTGTSFASFAELWHYLKTNGWNTAPGKGLASWHYFPPGSDSKARDPILNTDFFNSEDAVIYHVRRMGLERPAPVVTQIRRPQTSPKPQTGSHVSNARSPPSPSSSPAAAREKSRNKKSTTPRSSKNTPAFAAATNSNGNGDTSPASSCFPMPKSPTEIVAATSANGHRRNGRSGNRDAVATRRPRDYNSSSSSSSSVGRSDLMADIGSGGGQGSGSDSSNSGSGSGSDDSEAEGRGEEIEEVEMAKMEVRRSGGSGGGSSALELIVGGGSKRDRHGRKNAVRAKRRGGKGEATKSKSTASKRSGHGRTMQVEAMHVSSSRGAPNLAGEVMRQAVMARGLSSSPPAPSPSKRPKRSALQLPPQELARLADKKVKCLRGLLAGTERPYMGPCGVEGPVAEVVKFVRAAYGAWMVRQAGPKASSSEVTGAIVLAGPSGTGKSTAYQAAMRTVAASMSGGTLRFVTINCDRLRDNGGGPNDVFSRVLGAVTGSSARVGGDRALKSLGKMAEPPPFFVVFCLENGGTGLDPLVLELLLDMAYSEKPLFAVVCMVASIDRGMVIGFEQGNKGRECPMVEMMPCKEDRLRAILGQALGASGPEDKDGEIVASLVNKGALDVIAKTVARVSGSVRIALSVCELAFIDRLQELGQYITAPSGEASARGPARAQETATVAVSETETEATAGGASSVCATAALVSGPSSSSSSSSSSSPSSSPSLKSAGNAAAASVLLTVAGGKSALNRFLVGPGTA